MTKDIEREMMNFAGYLTQTWVETIACFIGTSGDENEKTRNNMLLQIRDAELAKIDAIERQLGIAPTTAQIRAWFKSQKKDSGFEDWLRNKVNG